MKCQKVFIMPDSCWTHFEMCNSCRTLVDSNQTRAGLALTRVELVLVLVYQNKLDRPIPDESFSFIPLFRFENKAELMKTYINKLSHSLITKGKLVKQKSFVQYTSLVRFYCSLNNRFMLKCNSFYVLCKFEYPDLIVLIKVA